MKKQQILPRATPSEASQVGVWDLSLRGFQPAGEKAEGELGFSTVLGNPDFRFCPSPVRLLTQDYRQDWGVRGSCHRVTCGNSSG